MEGLAAAAAAAATTTTTVAVEGVTQMKSREEGH